MAEGQKVLSEEKMVDEVAKKYLEVTPPPVPLGQLVRGIKADDAKLLKQPEERTSA